MKAIRNYVQVEPVPACPVCRHGGNGYDGEWVCDNLRCPMFGEVYAVEHPVGPPEDGAFGLGWPFVV